MRKLYIFLKKEKLWTSICIVLMLLSSTFTIIQAGFVANIITFTTNLEKSKQIISQKNNSKDKNEDKDEESTQSTYQTDNDLSQFRKVIKAFNILRQQGNFEATQYILAQRDMLFNFILGMIFLLFVLITQTLFFLRDFSNQYFTYRVTNQIRKSFFNKIISLNFLFHKNKQKGDILSRSINDIQIIEGNVYSFLESLIYGPTIVLMGLSTLMYISVNFTLILIVIILLLSGSIYIVSFFFKKVVRLTQEKISNITTHIEVSLHMIDVIKIFNREAREKNKFKKLLHRYLQLLKKASFINFLNRPINEFFISVAVVVIVFYTSSLIWNEEISINKVFIFFSILIYISPYLQRVNNGFFVKQKISVAINRLFENIYDEADEKLGDDDLDKVLLKTQGDSYQGNLEFKNVSFAYQKGEKTLSEISFEIKKGEFIAIVGESGGGKTTLLNMIPLLICPYAGDILYDGISYKNLSLESVRRHIAFVPQENILFPSSVKNNILYGKIDASDEEVVAAAKLANIHDVIMDFSEGYQTDIGEQGSKLSVGQKQRISIARALIKNPKLLILDEATSALDSYSEKLIQESLKKVIHNKTIIAIAHRLSTIMEADKIIVINNGRIEGIGKHEELLKNNQNYKKLYQIQFNQTLDSGH